MGDETTMQKDFYDELDILSSLRCLKHPNIINLITAYSKGTTYNFIFPVAEGDLQDLLYPKSSIPDFKIDVNNMLRSLWGLSSAIEAVHEYSAEEFQACRIGCHYDIKPGNILRQNGRLILSDFGLSRLRQANDGSRSLFKMGEGCYLAPECEPSENDFKPGRIGRSSDIWSFGCVLAETLAYLSAENKEGPAAVKKFRMERKIKLGPLIGYHFFAERGVNPEVLKFLERFLGDTSTYGGDFESLAFIIKDMLQFDEDKRPTARSVTRALFHLAEKNILKEICETLISHASVLDLDLQIELLRFRIWGDTVGLIAEPIQVLSSAYITKPYSHQECQAVDDILHQCLREVKYITAQLAREDTPSHRLSYHLRTLHESLWEMQPEQIRKNMINRLEAEMMDKINIPNIQETLTSINTDPSLELMGSNKSLLDSRRVAYLNSMREIADAMLQRESSDEEFAIEKASLISPTIELGHHTVKTIEGSNQRVLIESIKYEDSWVQRTDALIARVNAIASLRSRDVIKKTFPVLRCKGYYHDASQFRFGIVYELPSFSVDVEPMNLVKIINQTQSRTKQPSLNTKFNLACLLVSHILSFHRSGWLHKNISAFNVIFLPKDMENMSKSLSVPYFVGFNHARQSDEAQYSVLPPPEVMEYQHPVYLKNTKRSSDNPVDNVRGFRQEFDYYSVGLVLLEIAFWRSLQDITKKVRGSPEELKGYLLDERVPLVSTYMGNVYENAVRSCLTCYQNDSVPPTKVRENFSKNVVLPLSGCSL